MYEYGNARIAALRARLLGPGMLRQLAGSESPAALLEQLGHFEDWRPFVAAPLPGVRPQRVGAVGTDAARAVLAAIERHRSARLGALPCWYEPPARALVEALVLPLDWERVVALLRLRVAGVGAEMVLANVVPGAILDARWLADVARASTPAASLRLLARAGLIDPHAARRLGAHCERAENRATMEAGLAEAWSVARQARAVGGSPEAARVGEVLAGERAAERAVLAELSAHGIEAAASAERVVTLARLDTLARRARRDPLGIGVVAGYVAAVEAQAIRLRAVLCRVTGRWSRARVAAYLPSGG